MNKLLAIIGVAVLAVGNWSAAQAQDMRALAGWDATYVTVGGVIDPFLREIEGVTGSAIQRFGPETVPPFEQLEPVGSGVFDMLITNGAYHYNQSAVGMTVEALAADSTGLRSSGIWDLIDQEYHKLGLKLVATLLDHGGYNILLKEPLDDKGLAGLRVRGTPVYHPLIEALGGSPVVMAPAEIYPALERGIVDGAAWPAVGALGYRWFEVADYMMRPTFGTGVYLVFMNLERWNSFDADKQKAIADVAEAFEVKARGIFSEIVKAEETALTEQGMQITHLPEQLLPTLSSAWFEGVMALAGRQNPDAVAKIEALAATAELAP
ncbi:TRAP transporter substrate-binding protein DctP [Aquibium sp. LZ166]|uniref:TRAP transporter substrate-binding protein DctP n=1 Tax=Aquibium pacificus TaxID=3153579 RepID=A0ABV3SKH4_9HYPH